MRSKRVGRNWVSTHTRWNICRYLGILSKMREVKVSPGLRHAPILGNLVAVVFALLFVLSCLSGFLFHCSIFSCIVFSSYNPSSRWHELELERKATLVFLVSTVSEHTLSCYLTLFCTCVLSLVENTLLRVCQMIPYCKMFAKLNCWQNACDSERAWLIESSWFQHENTAHSFLLFFSFGFYKAYPWTSAVHR